MQKCQQGKSVPFKALNMKKKQHDKRMQPGKTSPWKHFNQTTTRIKRMMEKVQHKKMRHEESEALKKCK